MIFAADEMILASHYFKTRLRVSSEIMTLKVCLARMDGIQSKFVMDPVVEINYVIIKFIKQRVNILTLQLFNVLIIYL